MAFLPKKYDSRAVNLAKKLFMLNIQMSSTDKDNTGLIYRQTNF